MPTSFTNIQGIALKTIPSATKIKIKHILESLYGFLVERVQTLNMKGKKKKRGGILFAKPDYKKAYVTLKTPLSIDMNLFSLKMVEDARKRMNKKNVSSVVEDEEEEELLREKTRENVVKLLKVHINHTNMSLYLAFDYAGHDLYVSFILEHALVVLT
ncbi:hypothetical protein S245_036235 [Arachis hypogaea]